MDAVPAGDAEAGPVLALAVETTAKVTAPILTPGPGPALGTNAGSVLTPRSRSSVREKKAMASLKHPLWKMMPCKYLP